MPTKPAPFLIDDENPEWTAEDFTNARPIMETPDGPEMVAGMAKLAETQRMKRGRPPANAPKQLISFRLAPDVVAGLRASGAGYNGRVEKLLRAALARGRL